MLPDGEGGGSQKIGHFCGRDKKMTPNSINF